MVNFQIDLRHDGVPASNPEITTMRVAEEVEGLGSRAVDFQQSANGNIITVTLDLVQLMDQRNLRIEFSDSCTFMTYLNENGGDWSEHGIPGGMLMADTKESTETNPCKSVKIPVPASSLAGKDGKTSSCFASNSQGSVRDTAVLTLLGHLDIAVPCHSKQCPGGSAAVSCKATAIGHEKGSPGPPPVPADTVTITWANCPYAAGEKMYKLNVPSSGPITFNPTVYCECKDSIIE